MPEYYHPFTSTADASSSLRQTLLIAGLRLIGKRSLQSTATDLESIVRMRERVEALAKRFLAGSDDDITIAADTIGDVHVERVTPNDARREVVLYIHGGAFIMCSPLTHRGITQPLARYTQCEVIAVNYRLAPEQPYPAAVNDVVAVYRELLKTVNPKRITLAGDSAGGNLVLALLHAAKAEGLAMPSSTVCLSPVTDLTGASLSIRTNIEREALLPGERMHELAKLYLNGAYAREPTASPVYGDFTGLPPLLFHVGDTEILLDDSRRAVNQARNCGVETHLRIWPRLPHVFHAFSPHLPVAHVALKEIAEFMLSRFNSPD